MIKGFKDFLLRGNLIDIAVAFVIGGAFGAVTTAFAKVVVEILAKLGGAPNFDELAPLGLTSVGPFLTALVAFFIMAFVVYFGIVGVRWGRRCTSDACCASSAAASAWLRVSFHRMQGRST